MTKPTDVVIGNKADNGRTEITINGQKFTVSKIRIEAGVSEATSVTITIPLCKVSAELKETY